ncbi:unnamed protein product [Onchocerca ochengi]|uniref:Uncharacterized protein n=1 Tax=Onchocerca ochengi TaxID=42157 RepID=A0A182DYV7_ONCOC|nr:unnamed protein product [Onchocerca ochengi]
MATNRSLGKREPQKDIQGSDFGEVIFFDFERNSFLHFSGSIRLFDNSQRPQSTPQHQRTTTSIDTSDNSAGSLALEMLLKQICSDKADEEERRLGNALSKRELSGL